MSQTFIVPKEGRERMIERVAGFLREMTPGKAIRVEISPYRKTRSNQQNAYLWSVVYPSIISAGGEQLRGWTVDDIHEFCLGEIYGWETLDGLGRKRLRPVRRSSTMSTTEFSEYIAQIQQRMAEHGIYVPDPDPLHGVEP